MFNDHTYLYVEDDTYSRQIMQIIMEKAMEVDRLVIFDDSRNFMERVRALDAQPDIFLLDVHVQPYNGFEMLNMLHAEPEFQNARIIALTASVMNEEVEELKHGGFDGAIAKPLSVQTFPDLMKRIIAGEAVWHVA